MKKFISVITALIILLSCSHQSPNTNNNGGNNTNNGNSSNPTTINPTYTQGPYVTDIDGNVYPSVINCNLTWTSKNLNVSHYRNGDIIPEVNYTDQWDTITKGAWCYYNNDPALGAIYGKLYNYYAIIDPRGLAPQGWHVSSVYDWNKLIHCLDPTVDTFINVGHSTGTNIGYLLKERGNDHWFDNDSSKNSSGFTALGGGWRFGNPVQFIFMKIWGEWWANDNSNNGTSFKLEQGSIPPFGSMITKESWTYKMGLSVRLVKD